MQDNSARFSLQQCRSTGTAISGLPAVKPKFGNQENMCSIAMSAEKTYLIAPLINLISVRDHRRLFLRNEAAGLRSEGV